MVRVLLCGAAAVALAGAAAEPQGRSASFGQEGGESARSADGKWRIVSKAPAKPDAAWSDGRSIASLWLQGEGRPEKRLTRYRRQGTLFWLGGGRHAVFVHHDAHLQDARLFTLTGPASPQKAIQQVIEKGMAATPPRLATVENRLISASPAPDGGVCLNVEQSGFPPGRTEGSFVAKTAMFRVTPTGAAMRVETCNGAAASRID